MRTVIILAFGSTVLVAMFSVITHFIVYVGLRRRGVAIQAWKTGMPGYLIRLCEQLPPSTANVRLTQIAKWSNIAYLVAFLGIILTGPLIGQAPR